MCKEKVQHIHLIHDLLETYKSIDGHELFFIVLTLPHDTLFCIIIGHKVFTLIYYWRSTIQPLNKFNFLPFQIY